MQANQRTRLQQLFLHAKRLPASMTLALNRGFALTDNGAKVPATSKEAKGLFGWNGSVPLAYRIISSYPLNR